MLSFLDLSLSILLFRCENISGLSPDDGKRFKRAIGGQSLDSSNFVLYIDESTGARYVEVPYEYMKKWINDQLIWETVDYLCRSIIKIEMNLFL